MKKIISLSLIMLIAGSAVMAVSPDNMSTVKSDNGAQNQGAMQVDGNASPVQEQVQTQQQVQNRGDETQITTQERNQERVQVQDAESLRQNIQQRNRS